MSGGGVASETNGEFGERYGKATGGLLKEGREEGSATMAAMVMRVMKVVVVEMVVGDEMEGKDGVSGGGVGESADGGVGEECWKEDAGVAMREWLTGVAAPERMACPAVMMATMDGLERRRTDSSDGEPAWTPNRGEAVAQRPKVAAGSMLAGMLN